MSFRVVDKSRGFAKGGGGQFKHFYPRFPPFIPFFYKKMLRPPTPLPPPSCASGGGGRGLVYFWAIHFHQLLPQHQGAQKKLSVMLTKTQAREEETMFTIHQFKKKYRIQSFTFFHLKQIPTNKICLLLEVLSLKLE